MHTKTPPFSVGLGSIVFIHLPLTSSQILSTTKRFAPRLSRGLLWQRSIFCPLFDYLVLLTPVRNTSCLTDKNSPFLCHRQVLKFRLRRNASRRDFHAVCSGSGRVFILFRHRGYRVQILLQTSVHIHILLKA